MQTESYIHRHLDTTPVTTQKDKRLVIDLFIVTRIVTPHL